MKKYLLITALLLALCLTAMSCQNDTPPAESGTAPAESETAADTPSDTVPETVPDETEEASETQEASTDAPETETEAPEIESETVAVTDCDHEYGVATRVDDDSHSVTCKHCGEKKLDDHNWKAGDTVNGQTNLTCPLCGATKLEGEYVPDTEPETEAPNPFDPIYLADAEALVPNFAVDSTQHITSAEQVDDHLHIVPTIGDPYYVPFSQVTGGRYIAIKYRSDNAEGMAIQFYMASTGTGPVDDTTMLRQPINGDGEWHVALFDTQSMIDAGIYDGSYISYFRFDPMDCEYMLDENGERFQDDQGLWARYEIPVGAYIDIAYIAFFDSAEAADLYEHRPTHFVSADTLYENSLIEENLMYNQFMYASMEEDYIKLTGTDTDSYVTAILPGTTDAVTTKYLFIKYRTSHKDLLGQVFTGSGEIWEGDQNKLNFPYEGDGEWHLLMVDLTANETLTGNAGFLRYDFFQYGADPDTKEEHTIDVQYLAFFEDAESAAAFDAAYEAARA